MFDTRNDLPKTTRAKVIDLLDARLADATDLQTQLKQAHWNVKGPTFIALHELFDKINEAVEDYVDDLAERVVQLGGTAHGTARQAAKRSSLPEFPAVTDGRAHAAGGGDRAGRIRQAGAGRHRSGRQAGRQGHRRSVHGDLARHRQVAVVRRGAPAGEPVARWRACWRRGCVVWTGERHAAGVAQGGADPGSTSRATRAT